MKNIKKGLRRPIKKRSFSYTKNLVAMTKNLGNKKNELHNFPKHLEKFFEIKLC